MVKVWTPKFCISVLDISTVIDPSIAAVTILMTEAGQLEQVTVAVIPYEQNSLF